MSSIALLRAMRPRQWTKNIFVLAALVFAAGDERSELSVGPEAVIGTIVTFLAFCLASSAVYLLNDIVDVEKDRAHPEKKNRPIASGALSVQVAQGAAVALVVVALGLGWWVTGSVALILAIYMALNVGYSLKLKSIVLVDAFCIASGFLLRVQAGGEAVDVDISHWLFLCTLFLSLFLALNKRRAEIMLLGEEVAAHRPTLSEYSVGFLDQMVGVLAACTIVCYTMYTVDPDTASKFGEDNALVWTVPFVAFGIGRYMVIVQSGRGGGNPSRILLGGDTLFLLNTLAWAGTILWVVFGTGSQPA